ncbi:MAG: sensor histidine kinase [Rhizobiales bacterium]|nr:sensor histidine kinase [Hyphomicrobiales bacterium]
MLLWVTIPLLTVSAIALYDTQSYANKTANELFDQTLAGSTIAIAERVVVTENGELDVDIPYIALDLLTSAAHNRIFYRINDENGDMITGYKELVLSDNPVNEIFYSSNQNIVFFDGKFRESAIRLASYSGIAIGPERSHKFEVILAETTQARIVLSNDILISTGIRLSILMVTALVFVWIGIMFGLKPLSHLQQAIGRRSLEDLRPITHKVPQEVETLISGINHFMKRLDNSLISLRNFTSNAEHQIKTPLSVVKMNIYLANSATSAAEKQKYFDIANRAINDCERILSQFILLAKVENESADKSGLAFDLVAVIKNNIERESAEAFKNKIDLGFENQLGREIANLVGNKTLFDEMLHNLIHNIFIHGVNCTIATIYLYEDAEFYCLAIEDDGIGVVSDQYEIILDRFVQGNNPLSLGSGLGLSITAEIMQIFGGSIKLSRATRSEQMSNNHQKGFSVELKFKKIPL